MFSNAATNLATGSDSNYEDVFLKDRVSGAVTRVSTSTSGGDGNGDSQYAKVSADGRFVVFQSFASNLTTGDTNSYPDILVWDRNDSSVTNITKAMSVVSNPNNGNYNPDVAFDNGWCGVVVFQTAKNLVAEDTSNGTDIYAYDMSDNTVQLVSSKADGSGVSLSSEDASVSGDGRFVVFTSYSDALVPGDTNGTRDIFVKDLYTGAIALVSKSAAGVAANGPSSRAQISLGGEWIVFESSATNLASTDGNNTSTDVFRVSNPLLKDTLIGGAGNDTYVLARADIVQEQLNGGIDTISSSFSYSLVDTDGAGALGSNIENLTLTGTGNLNGTGNTGNNRIDGGLGNDRLTGGTGNDTYIVDATGDEIVESGTAITEIDSVSSSVNWTLGARLENLTLTGTATINGGGNAAANSIIGNGADNTLTGGSGNDTLNGGAGIDTLIGSAGSDRLTGGTGTDVFVFNSKDGSDTITDFVSGTDDLRISQSAFSIGDGDLLVEGALTRAAPGSFSKSAELVIFTANLFSLSATAAATAIGSATSAYSIGAKALFAVDNGTNSQLYLFTAADANALVSAGELTLLERNC